MWSSGILWSARVKPCLLLLVEFNWTECRWSCCYYYFASGTAVSEANSNFSERCFLSCFSAELGYKGLCSPHDFLFVLLFISLLLLPPLIYLEKLFDSHSTCHYFTPEVCFYSEIPFDVAWAPIVFPQGNLCCPKMIPTPHLCTAHYWNFSHQSRNYYCSCQKNNHRGSWPVFYLIPLVTYNQYVWNNIMIWCEPVSEPIEHLCSV